MDTKDTSESSPQPPPAGDAFSQPEPVPGSSQNATPQNRPRSIVRTLAGRWKGIILCWLLVFPPVAYLIYLLVEPTYEAFSVLHLEPMEARLFEPAQNTMDSRAFEPYLQTQVHLITTDQVLDAAISADPRIVNLPMIKTSKDPKADLREKMDVGIVDKHTYLIRVALASADPVEAALIVNAVVDAYIGQHNEYHRSANKALHRSLTDEVETLTREIRAKKNELKKLYERGHVELLSVNVKPVAVKQDDSRIPSLEVVSEEQYSRVTDRLLQADLELIDAQAKLETAKRAWKNGEARLGDQPVIAGNSNTTAAEKLRDLEAAVEEVKRKRIGYIQYLERVKVQTKMKETDALAATMVNQEQASLLKMHELITQKLEQLNFETKQDVYRVTLHDRAGVPKVPLSNHRLPLLAIAPFGVLFLILVVFLTQEIKGTRTAARGATSSGSPS